MFSVAVLPLGLGDRAGETAERGIAADPHVVEPIIGRRVKLFAAANAGRLVCFLHSAASWVVLGAPPLCVGKPPGVPPTAGM